MIGCYGGVVFTVSRWRVLTPSNISGSTGSDWATHELILCKSKSQYMGPQLKTYSFDLLLSNSLGVPARRLLNQLQQLAEKGCVDYLIIGNEPVGGCPFKLTKVTDDWKTVRRAGLIFNRSALRDVECSITLEEYA